MKALRCDYCGGLLDGNEPVACPRRETALGIPVLRRCRTYGGAA